MSTTRNLHYVQAFTEGLAQSMGEDGDVFVAGEDVAGGGGLSLALHLDQQRMASLICNHTRR